VLDRVLAHVGEHGALPVRAGCADAERQRRGALAGGEPDHLVRLAVDPAELVQEGDRRVQALQPLRHSREDLE
jgi:hypothetical protein